MSAESDSNRAYVVAAVTGITDNTEAVYFRLRAVARVRLMRYGIFTPDDMRDALRGAGQYSLSILEREVGDAVADVFRGWLAKEQRRTSRPVLMTILAQLLDLSNSETQQLLGQHYMPEPDDIPTPTPATQTYRLGGPGWKTNDPLPGTHDVC